jgi:hypothetical protein
MGFGYATGEFEVTEERLGYELKKNAINCEVNIHQDLSST